MSDAQLGSDIRRREQDKIGVFKQKVAEENFDGRKSASNWEEFQEFEKEVRFKIRTEIDSIKTRGEESIKRANDSIAISPEKFEKVKTEQEIKIQEIKLEGMKLGRRVQEVVGVLTGEIREKIKGENLSRGASWKEAAIQDEVSKQIIKIQKMYEDFLNDIEGIKQKIDRILFDMEDNLRKSSIKKVEEVL